MLFTPQFSSILKRTGGHVTFSFLSSCVAKNPGRIQKLPLKSTNFLFCVYYDRRACTYLWCQIFLLFHLFVSFEKNNKIFFRNATCKMETKWNQNMELNWLSLNEAKKNLWWIGRQAGRQFIANAKFFFARNVCDFSSEFKWNHSCGCAGKHAYQSLSLRFFSVSFSWLIFFTLLRRIDKCLSLSL